MKISVIIPAYNAEKTLESCIDSILKQTIDSLEIIVVDDGSTDDTELICKKYLGDNRFRYIKKENGGPASARNVGLDMACGEYVGFVDADDSVAPEMYENMYNFCVNNNAEMGVCDIERFKDGEFVEQYTDSRRGGVFNKEQIKTEVLPFCLGYIGKNGRINKFEWSVLRHIFNKSFLKKNSIRFDEDLKNSEDCLFVFESICNSQNIIYIKEFYYRNNINVGSLSWRYSPDYWEQRNHLIDRVFEVSNEYIEKFDIRSLDCFILRCAYASAKNVSLGFDQRIGLKSLFEYKNIVCDGRVKDAANHVNPAELDFEWQRFLVWVQRKQYVQMYCYYKDIYGYSKWYHLVRRINKAINRRVRKG